MPDYPGNTELVYDLRQKYAEIVGFHLEKVAESRIEENYVEYFKNLENLFTVVKHKFKESKIKDNDEDAYNFSFVEPEEEKAKQKKTDLERYEDLRQIAITISNKYKDAFLGNTSNPDHVAEIQKSLREIEMFLYYIMDKAKMFGAVASNRGL